MFASGNVQKRRLTSISGYHNYHTSNKSQEHRLSNNVNNITVNESAICMARHVGIEIYNYVTSSLLNASSQSLYRYCTFQIDIVKDMLKG